MMHKLLHLKFLSLALLTSSALALTIPQGTGLVSPSDEPNTTSDLNGTSSNLNGTIGADPKKFECTRKGSTTTMGPSNADCASALRAMPLNPNVGTFYSVGAGNFQLPYFETYKTCTVLISMRSRYDRVQSSWLAVHLAALELNAACEATRSKTGWESLLKATTSVDDLGSMQIFLQPSSYRLDGNDGTNATATA
ncbi:hypothetical protein BDR22DRAFT_291405 [Usnea florida]